DRKLYLEPGQLIAEAMVDATAEGEQLDVLAGDVKSVRVFICRRVAGGRRQYPHRHLRLLERGIAEFGLFQSRARGELNRRIVAQAFLNGAKHQAVIGLQASEFDGVTEQG